MKRKPTLAPRNPFVVPARQRKAGAHGKSVKATRRKAKMELRREYGVTIAQHPFKVPGLGLTPSAPTTTSFAWRLKRRPAPVAIQFAQQPPAE